MKRCQPLLAGLILNLAGVCLFGLSVLAPVSTALAQEATHEVEYASLPKAPEAANDANAPAPRASNRTPRRQSAPRTTPAPAPQPSSVDLEPAAPPPVLEEPLPPWRVTVAGLLTPFGINTLLAKIGMSGPSADILGCLLLLALVSVVLLVLLRLAQAMRHHLADKVRQKREMEAHEKVEPAIDPAKLKRHTRGGPDSRLAANSRNGPHSHPNSDTRGGPASRLGAHTRGGPDSRMFPDSRMGGATRNGPDSRLASDMRGGPDSRLGAPTRSGPDSRLGAHTRGLDSRMVHDPQAPDSRMYPGTRGPTGLQSQFGESQFGNSMLGQPGQETRGHNPVVQKSDVPNAPPDFDQARFLRKARVYFLRLQLAWDKSDLASIRQFAAGPVFNEFRKQILERGDTTNTTDVLAIQTELIGIEIVGGNYIASVKFTGMIKETENPAQAPFEEVWNLSMPREKKGDWVLSGIAQYK